MEADSYQVGTNPRGIAVDPKLGYVYIANSGDDTVSVCPLGLACATPIIVNVGSDPTDVAVDQRTHTVYVTDNSANTISVLQPRTNPPPSSFLL